MWGENEPTPHSPASVKVGLRSIGPRGSGGRKPASSEAVSVTGGTELHSRHELLEVFGLELHRPRSAEEARRLSQEARQELDAFLAKERRSSLRASSSAVRALALAVTIQGSRYTKSDQPRFLAVEI